MHKKPAVIGFGSFRLDMQGPVLLDSINQKVSLRKQSLRVMQVLAIHSDKIVSRQTLFDEVWGGTKVTGDSLVQCIGDIRHAIDDHDHNLIQSIPKKGYRFNARYNVLALPLCSTCRALVISGTIA